MFQFPSPAAPASSSSSSSTATSTGGALPFSFPMPSSNTPSSAANVDHSATSNKKQSLRSGGFSFQSTASSSADAGGGGGALHSFGRSLPPRAAAGFGNVGGTGVLTGSSGSRTFDADPFEGRGGVGGGRGVRQQQQQQQQQWQRRRRHQRVDRLRHPAPSLRHLQLQRRHRVLHVRPAIPALHRLRHRHLRRRRPHLRQRLPRPAPEQRQRLPRGLHVPRNGRLPRLHLPTGQRQGLLPPSGLRGRRLAGAGGEHLRGRAVHQGLHVEWVRRRQRAGGPVHRIPQVHALRHLDGQERRRDRRRLLRLQDDQCAALSDQLGVPAELRRQVPDAGQRGQGEGRLESGGSDPLVHFDSLWMRHAPRHPQKTTKNVQQRRPPGTSRHHRRRTATHSHSRRLFPPHTRHRRIRPSQPQENYLGAAPPRQHSALCLFDEIDGGRERQGDDRRAGWKDRREGGERRRRGGRGRTGRADEHSCGKL
mmetsp:Transcript_10919/g.22810  ORF Transcript_10919/g.22810 Transcript_10919/m.22810 type:complete len:479 (-) Transcript_10919:401-1837(-)